MAHSVWQGVLIPSAEAGEYSRWAPVPRALISTAGGLASFFVGAAGGKNLISYAEGIPWYVHMLNAAMTVVDIVAIAQMFDKPIKKPSHCTFLINLLAIIGGFTALTYYTGGRFGAQLMGFSELGAEIIALGCFSLRFYLRALSVLLCRDKIEPWVLAFKRRNYPEISQMLMAVVVGMFIALFITDPLLSAIKDIGRTWLHLDMQNYAVGSYTVMALIATIGLPSFCLWANTGLQKIRDEFGSATLGERCSKNKMFLLAALPLSALLYMMVTLGAASSPQGEAFSSWVGAVAAYVLKMIFVLLYSVLSALKGVEAILRTTSGVVAKKCTALGSYCFKKKGESLTAKALPAVDQTVLVVELGKV